ncbi:hypothetical protein SEET0821_11086 [Salmonella enterica subsp. enterica serovar Tennessee str. TXSC_TXSC08-21]|nr:hypothetical protein SEET0821_11086 [Salmonella enterica subsp. enterica serovar Tennessee str. TXSC_TXSC08-21]
MNQSLTLIFLIAAGVGLVVTKQYYGAYYADIIDDSDRYAVELAW